jgi:hypothetical protein
VTMPPRVTSGAIAVLGLLSMSAGFASPASASVTATSARIIEAVDPIDDQRSVYVVFGSRDKNIALGCSNVEDRSTIRVSILFDKYIGDARPGYIAGGRELQYRFDGMPAETVFWFSHDRTVSAELDKTRPVQFILKMKSTKALQLRTFDYDGDAVDMGFLYSDPTDLIAQVLTRCGYDQSGKPLKRR